MKKLCYPAIFHPEDIGYSVTIPDFEKSDYGCNTECDSFDEAYQMAFDAIGLCIEDLIEQHKELPELTRPENMTKDGKDFIVPIVFDMEKYQEQNKVRMVKKTLTIPEWLNDLAEKNNVNFSEALPVALANQLGVSL